jgi:hypothetical protein
MDVKVEDGKVTAFRTRVALSFKYDFCISRPPWALMLPSIDGTAAGESGEKIML